MPPSTDSYLIKSAVLDSSSHVLESLRHSGDAVKAILVLLDVLLATWLERF